MVISSTSPWISTVSVLALSWTAGGISRCPPSSVAGGSSVEGSGSSRRSPQSQGKKKRKNRITVAAARLLRKSFASSPVYTIG